MSFREKTAWISLLAVAAFAVFWLHAVSEMSPIQRMQPGEMLPILILGVVVEVVCAIGLGIAAAITTPPSEVDAPADERDRLIDAHAAKAPYFILIAGGLFVTWALTVGASGFAAVNGLLAVVVVAELVRYATQIVLYRRGL